ncbi:glycoside hydrolase family 2 TIM barrel-domain containing protein [Aestuariivivens sediminis]|uniref:glycoside hydrolase family 2 TIM barrel-domain containing protein n=1 Tax=Aestuariivivens sediminis TaxID=2913557 RepID=UPI001F5944E2|nr:glycoside hydrolase family 2 TIM barrel-domain containing protein [Aestuariivivens sediminis]
MRYLVYKCRYFIIFVLFCFLCRCNSQNIKKSGINITKSEVRLTDRGFHIFLNGIPFYIKGAGLGDNGSLESLKEHGANAVRTWSTNNGKDVLDKAHELGLKVMMGIWVGLERHGFDYNDEKAVQEQLERIRKRVIELKDHPALIVWGVGNEMNHHSQNPKVWDAVNEISEMIHEVDPYHITTTPLAGMDKKDVDLIIKRAPDLDFLSVQLYAGIEVLPELIAKSNYKGPLLVTEWGATGYWEVSKTEWGAPLENNSSIKADFYGSRYQKSILSLTQQVMGSFVFLWGQKQERTPTWFGMFMPNGNETESIDVMHYSWKGEWPENRTPRLVDFTLEGQRAINNIRLKAGTTYSAEVEVTDPDNDTLIFSWEIMRESESNKSGGDAEYIPDVITGLFPVNTHNTVNFLAPPKSGAYRLFVYVEDGNNHTAHANIPFWVED